MKKSDSNGNLSRRFVKHGYLAPMNVLWTYYFINGMREEAMGVWERYVKDCPQIMFQKVCQTARSRNSLQVSQPVFVTVTIRYCDNQILLGFHSEVLGLVADTERKILHILSATKSRTSEWKPRYYDKLLNVTVLAYNY